MHYTAPWHQQENVFLPSSRPPCVEDLHRQAKLNLKSVLRGERCCYCHMSKRASGFCHSLCKHSEIEKQLMYFSACSISGALVGFMHSSAEIGQKFFCLCLLVISIQYSECFQNGTFHFSKSCVTHLCFSLRTTSEVMSFVIVQCLFQGWKGTKGREGKPRTGHSQGLFQ